MLRKVQRHVCVVEITKYGCVWMAMLAPWWLS